MAGVDFNRAGIDQRTALHLAATEGHLHIVSFIVDKALASKTALSVLTPEKIKMSRASSLDALDEQVNIITSLEPQDRFGNRPIDNAKAFKHAEIVNCLETAINNMG